MALAAGQNGTLSPFRIFVEDDQAVAERSCWVKMLDATVRLRQPLGGSDQCTVAQQQRQQLKLPAVQQLAV